MNQVLKQLLRTMELNDAITPLRNKGIKRQLEIQDTVKHHSPLLKDVLQQHGLWNMDDPFFYCNEEVYCSYLKLFNMCMVYGIMNIKHITKLDESCDFFKGLSFVPIIKTTCNHWVYELKAPFTKSFFEKLINNDCNLLEFGSEYIFKTGNKYYGTYKLFELFNNQDFKNFPYESANPCNTSK